MRIETRGEPISASSPKEKWRAYDKTFGYIEETIVEHTSGWWGAGVRCETGDGCVAGDGGEAGVD